ncbi:MAG: hypothetical protein ABI430_00390 [Candidatus Taylorbacteria bacterium]
MFGIIDRFYAFRKCRKGYFKPPKSWKPEIILYDEKPTSWFCFVPSIVSKNLYLRKGLLPREGTVYVYTISSFNLIKQDPLETLHGLNEIYSEAVGPMEVARDQRGHAIKILGISLGNVFGVRLASQAGLSLQKIVSLVGGGRLGISAWDSILTGHIVKRSGLRNAEEYEEKVSSFSPIRSIAGLPKFDVNICLGTNDMLIRYHHGIELADSFKKQQESIGGRLHCTVYPGADHGSTMFLVAGRNILSHALKYR